MLGLGLMPESFYAAETADYLPRINTYGLPLDSRADYTKSDWILWSACLTGNTADFETFHASGLEIRQRNDLTRPVERLALHFRRNTTWIPGPFSRRRLL